MIRALIISLVLLVPGAFASVSIDEALQDLDDAIASHEQSTNPQSIFEAAAILEHAFEEQDIETSGASLALGNAYFIAGDLGQAILHYKRGTDIDPRSPELRDNLKHARSLVEPAPRADGSLSFSKIALSWRGFIARRALLTLSLGFLMLSSVIATLAIIRVRIPRPRLLAFTSLTLAILAIVPLGFEAWTTHANPEIVIVDPNTQAMSGPSASAYDPVFEQPLGAGVEARVIDSKDGWIHVELGSGDRCWIDQERARYVVPQARS